MSKGKNKTKPDRVVFDFRCDSETAKGIYDLMKITGKTQSEILRGLIPKDYVVEAARLFQQSEGEDERDISRLFVESFIDRLFDKIRFNNKIRLGLHLAVVMKQRDRNRKIAELFIKYQKALKKEPGYCFRYITRKFEGKDTKFYGIIGPGDDFDKLSEQMVDIWLTLEETSEPE